MSDFTITPGTVEAIQGNPVSSEILGASEDGYVLTWDNADGYIVARPVTQSYTGLRQAAFTSSGTWTCPAGVTSVILIGCGGGGGGASGEAQSTRGGGGGGGAIQQTSYAQVTSGNIYTVTVGAGGTGGTSNSNPSTFINGNDGSPTTVSFSGVNIFYANGAGGAQGNGLGGLNFATGSVITYSFFNENNIPPFMAGMGSSNANNISDFINGQANFIGGFSGGTTPVDWTHFSSGGGGGAGPQGNGGDGGVTGSNGSSAATNTGAGGGGGGSYAGGNSGAGGNGGSGYLYILY